MDTVYSDRQLRYLDAMGIPAWTHRRSPQNHLESPMPEARPVTGAGANPIDTCQSADDFTIWLSRASLARSARSEMLEGNRDSALLIIEDASSSVAGQRPFSGPVSRLFDAMLKAIGLSRRNTLLATLAPSQDSMTSSGTSLAELQDLSLRAVLFYSIPSGQHGLNDFESLRNRDHVLSGEVPCIVSYHPAHLMSHNDLKRAAWDDLKRVKQLLE